MKQPLAMSSMGEKVLLDFKMLSEEDKESVLQVLKDLWHVLPPNTTFKKGSHLTSEEEALYSYLSKRALKIRGIILTPIDTLAKTRELRTLLKVLTSEIVLGVDKRFLNTRYEREQMFGIFDLCAKAIVEKVYPGRNIAALYTRDILSFGAWAVDQSFPDYRINKILHVLVSRTNLGEDNVREESSSETRT